MKPAIFLFGEAEKGEFCLPFHCRSIEQLSDNFGNPPDQSLGLDFAVQAILLEMDCFFFRVKEEGFSIDDYFRGLRFLEKGTFFHSILAIGLPGVGNQEIIHATSHICHQRKNPLILSERDLYDYLTDT